MAEAFSARAQKAFNVLVDMSLILVSVSAGEKLPSNNPCSDTRPLDFPYSKRLIGHRKQYGFEHPVSNMAPTMLTGAILHEPPMVANPLRYSNHCFPQITLASGFMTGIPSDIAAIAKLGYLPCQAIWLPFSSYPAATASFKFPSRQAKWLLFSSYIAAV